VCTAARQDTARPTSNRAVTVRPLNDGLDARAAAYRRVHPG
jgi:hypothetical protein